MTAAVPQGSVVLQGFMPPHPVMLPGKPKGDYGKQKRYRNRKAVSLRADSRPGKGGGREMNRLQ
ncbi:MAG: hypothetical protein MUE37_07720 [Bacteroidales bacterium]|nr:hypothetical protein [Bacteroidales bacterium]